MKFTDELKNKIDNAGTEEEARNILSEVKNEAENAGIILDDAELDKAAGGNFVTFAPQGYMPGARF